ncbi:DNA repair and recombination protein [Sparassis crispa]|uniref:DNA repair and recombination protein n=1 Tax=Sparassis crispa TaxID=139825 RepID=A0A401GPU7_9APHY|nr:DNA repair and recombination protein [Sparassis crispa]GBE83784.1 DNA repair and recombination protein [Sparassis crispa]
MTPELLAEGLNIPLTSSQAVFSATQAPRAVPMTQSAASMVSSAKTYITLCDPLDKLLDGGLKRGHILEISGPPGSAKETLAANIVRSFVSTGDEVLFIDMQNMMSPATLNRILHKSYVPPEHRKLVHHLNLHSLPDLMIFLNNLPYYLGTHPKITLLVLNSLSFPFQSAVGLGIPTRNALLEKVRQTLSKTCASSNLTIVITSQLATKMLNPDGSAANFDTGSRAVIVPQLGNTYLPSGRTSRVIVVPQTRSTGVLRLLLSPTHVQGRRREESYEKIGGAIQ